MAAVRAVAAGQPGGASLAPLTHLSAAPAPTQPQLSQLQLTALARRNNCFARGETSGPGRVSAAAPGPASDVMADVTRAGENYTGAITGQAAITTLTPGGARLEHCEHSQHSIHWVRSRLETQPGYTLTTSHLSFRHI